MARDCMEYVKRMSPRQRKAVLNGKPWTELQRINYVHNVLTARLDWEDGDPRKNGIMLERCRVLEAHMRRMDND